MALRGDKAGPGMSVGSGPPSEGGPEEPWAERRARRRLRRRTRRTLGWAVTAAVVVGLAAGARGLMQTQLAAPVEALRTGLRKAPVLGRREREHKTVAQRLEEYGAAARGRLQPRFAAAGVAYPPERVVLVGLKDERRLELYAARRGELRHVCDWQVLGASGTLGPKLRYGDLQVPEGVYKVEFLNPNSLYHLSLRLNYPNKFDREKGRLDGRQDLGRDIMIHGGAGSVGCLAVGDEAAEELFVLAADTGLESVKVLLAPVDFRRRELPAGVEGLPPWADELYAKLKGELRRVPGPS